MAVMVYIGKIGEEVLMIDMPLFITQKLKSEENIRGI